MLTLWNFQSMQTPLATAQDEISYKNSEYYIYAYLNPRGHIFKPTTERKYVQLPLFLKAQSCHFWKYFLILPVQNYCCVYLICKNFLFVSKVVFFGSKYCVLFFNASIRSSKDT